MKLRPASKSEFEIITNVWEASVRANHDFLSTEDILELRSQILNDWHPSVAVTVFTDESDDILDWTRKCGHYVIPQGPWEASSLPCSTVLGQAKNVRVSPRSQHL